MRGEGHNRPAICATPFARLARQSRRPVHTISIASLGEVGISGDKQNEMLGPGDVRQRAGLGKSFVATKMPINQRTPVRQALCESRDIGRAFRISDGNQ